MINESDARKKVKNAGVAGTRNSLKNIHCTCTSMTYTKCIITASISKYMKGKVCLSLLYAILLTRPLKY